MPRKTPNKNYDYFSANVQAAEIESQLVQSQQRIAELESLNAQLQSLLASNNGKSRAAQFTVQLERIICNKQQVRRYFDPDKLATLTASIKEVGVRSPLWVRPYSDDKYLLIAGERRYRAAREAGLTEVPVAIVEVDETSALKLSLLENLQREDLNPVEETEGILHLLSMQLDCTVKEVIAVLNRKAHLDKKQVEWSEEDTENVFRKQWSVVENVFTTVGKLSPESFRVSRLPLLNLPADVLEVLRSGQIEYTKAKAIATLKDKAARTKILEEALANSLSLSQIKERVSAAKPTKEKEELKSRVDTTYKQLKKSKQLWQDPKKRKKLESLLSQLEKLIESESSSIAQASERPIVKTADSEPESLEQTEEESATEADGAYKPPNSIRGTAPHEKGLSDQELGELLGVSNLILRDYRAKGKKPPAGLAKKLQDWEVKGERWVRKT